MIKPSLQRDHYQFVTFRWRGTFTRERIIQCLAQDPGLRRRAYVPVYFANPSYCSHLNDRPSASSSVRITLTQCTGIIEACLHNPASVTTVCTRRHRFLLRGSYLARSLSCVSYLLSRLCGSQLPLVSSLRGHA